MISAKFDYERDGSYLVTPDGARSLLKICSEFLGESPEFKVVFDDGLSLDGKDDIEIALSSDFARTSSIKSFEISGHRKVGETYHHLTLSVGRWIGSARFNARLVGSPAAIAVAKSSIEREERILRSSYDRVYHVPDFVWWLLVIFFCALVLAWPAASWLISEGGSLSVEDKTSLRTTLFFYGMALGLPVLYIGSKARNFLFPSFVLAIGKSAVLNERRAELRKQISWVIIIPTVMAALYAVLRS